MKMFLLVYVMIGLALGYAVAHVQCKYKEEKNRSANDILANAVFAVIAWPLVMIFIVIGVIRILKTNGLKG